MTKKSDISFQEAMDELKNILVKIESDDTQIDAIPLMIKRAKELQDICQGKLTQIQVLIDAKNE